MGSDQAGVTARVARLGQHRSQQHLFTGDVFAIELDGWRPGRGTEVFRRPAVNT